MKVNIYCDESRQSQSRYMLIGGIWIPQAIESVVVHDCLSFRQATGMTRELKWTKVSRAKLAEYKQFVDIFFAYPDVHLRCIVIDTHKLDYHTYHQGGRELGFYKFYYLLLSRNIKRGNTYYIYTDVRQNRESHRLTDLKTYINQYMRGSIVKAVEARSSKVSNPIQMADILIGAVGYQLEGYDTSPVKVEMARYIAQKAGLTDLTKATPKSRKDFNLWHLRLK